MSTRRAGALERTASDGNDASLDWDALSQVGNYLGFGFIVVIFSSTRLTLTSAMQISHS